MNAFALLKEDHQKVSGIFEKLEETTERAEKTRRERDVHLRVGDVLLDRLREHDERVRVVSLLLAT